MKILKKQLNNPWIKDIGIAGVKGLNDGCYSYCDCSVFCESYCTYYKCPATGDYMSGWWDGSESTYSSSYGGAHLLYC